MGTFHHVERRRLATAEMGRIKRISHCELIVHLFLFASALFLWQVAACRNDVLLKLHPPGLVMVPAYLSLQGVGLVILRLHSLSTLAEIPVGLHL